MLKTKDKPVDEVFLMNVAQRVPHFLTATLVNLTKTLLLQKEYFRNHPIWSVLESELFKRRNNLNKEQLADVIYSFGISGNGQKDFYVQLEETITDSPIPIESEYLQKIIEGYCQIDMGSPELYGSIVQKFIDRGLNNLSPKDLTHIAKCLGKATNVQKGGFGFYKEMEVELRNRLN